MANLFFRTNVAPYRIDTYNALHKEMDFEMNFLYDSEGSQSFDMKALYDQCNFQPHILKTITLFSRKYKVCTEIGDIIKKKKPKVVIVPEFKILTIQVLLYRWLHRAKFKVVSMCDDSYDMVSNDNDFSKIHKWARNIITPMLDDLLLVDNKVVEWYKAKFGKGIWLPIIRDEKKEKTAYERVLPISNKFQRNFNLKGQKILLFVGRLVPLKNIDRVIRSINKCKEDFTFVVVGDGPEMTKLKEVAEQCNHRVVFAGRYEGDEIRAWYNIADVFILASWQEAYGAVTNEALLAGCRCAISTHCGSTCLIDETNGVTFDPYNEREISSKLDTIMSEVRPCPEIQVRPHLMQFSFDETMKRVQKDLMQ